MGRERAQPEKAIASGSVQLEKQAFISKNDFAQEKYPKMVLQNVFRKERIDCLSLFTR
jgi:hypothetical protein